MISTEQLPIEQVRQEREQFPPTEKCHLHSAILYSEGVMSLCDQTDRYWLYWLVDTIAAQLHSQMLQEAIEEDERLRTLVAWTMEVIFDVGTPHYLEGRADFRSQPFYYALCQHPWAFDHFPFQFTTIFSVRDGNRWLLCLESEYSKNAQIEGGSR